MYHANSAWLPGGFLGVEVFFVISGYLITLLLIGEHERSGRVRLRQFWYARARRLLPALFTTLLVVTAYTAIFRRDALGQLRGDVIAGLAYVSNWYQIWVGQGYTASGDFSPLRHLWSLAVEEQFYLLWPLAMIVILRLGARRVQNVSWAFVAAAVAIAGVVAALYHPGPIATCELTPEAYWQLGDRCISKTDFLYLSTPTRAGGLLLGAALAMVWRPVALMRGPMRRRGRLLDVVGVVGFVTLGALTWYVHVVTPDGAGAWLFRGGFLITGLATVALIAAVTHRGTAAGPAMGNVVLVWIGVRSYGLYLYHWPIFQGIRRVTGNALTVPEFLVGVAATVVVADVSYRVIEIPIRRGTFGRWWRRLQLTRTDGARRIVASAGALLVALIVFAAVSVGTAPLRANEIATAQAEAAQFVGDPFAAASAAVRMGSSTSRRPPTQRRTTTVRSTTTTTSTSTKAVSTSTTAAPESTTTAPTTTVPPTTVAAPPAPAPAPPPPPGDPCATTPIDRYALGDSVMLGAAGNLAAAGFCVDAVVSRAFVNGLDQVIRLRADGRLGSTVVVSLGTNGRIGPTDLDRMMAELATVPRVIVLTTKADRGWVPPNNELLRVLPAAYPNVRLVDWADAAAACPGSCFYDDGIHLRPDGRTYFAQLITGALA